MGYVIRKWSFTHKSNMKGICFVIMGLAVEMLRTVSAPTPELAKFIMVYSWLDFSQIIASTLIFTGFSMLVIRINLSRIAANMFLVYLFHGGVLDVLGKAVERIKPGMPHIVFPVGCAIVFLVSYALSIIYKRIWGNIDDKFCLTDKMCKLIKLE